MQQNLVQCDTNELCFTYSAFIVLSHSTNTFNGLTLFLQLKYLSLPICGSDQKISKIS